MATQTEDTKCQVNVRLFGLLAERNGGRNLSLQVEEGTTLRQIASESGAEDLIDNGLLTALNDVVVDIDTPVVNDCEVALMPPVSGG